MTGRIHDLRLTNFKGFRRLDVRLGKLTVLTGTNSSGKSSVMHAIVLLEQSRDQDPPGFVLNGDLIELGDYEDVLFDRPDAAPAREQGPQVLEVGIRSTSSPWRHFGGSAQSDADFIPLQDRDDPIRVDIPWKHLEYVRADRLGPTLVHQKSHSAVVGSRSVGPRGEYAVHLLLTRGSEDVAAPLRLPGVGKSLEQQCGAWLELISSDTRIYPSNLAGTGSAVVRFSDGPLTGLSSGRPHRATNVGFGLSYALPVIVACLSARRGDLLLVENPESHLHPRGQGHLARLCVACARAGAQVVVETHSDHVLNAIRLGVAEGTLKPRDVSLVYFSRVEGGESRFEPLVIDVAGQIAHWPDGFFDQYLESLSALADFAN